MGVFFVIWLKGVSLNYCDYDCLINLGFWINIFIKLYVYLYYVYYIYIVANIVILFNSFIIGKLFGLFLVMNLFCEWYSVLYIKYFNKFNDEIKMYLYM